VAAFYLFLALCGTHRRAWGADHDPSTRVAEVAIFRNAAIRWSPDSVASFSGRGLAYRDGGRIAATTVTLPAMKGPHRITALLTVRPVPKTDREVFDRFDRAGSIRIAVKGGPDLEVLRFITAYGGRTDHEVDVTALAPLLSGRRTFLATIDTWTSPAWTVSLSLRYTPVADFDNASWVTPVYFTDNFNREQMPDGDSATVTIPPGLARVALRYTATGHCTDGMDADEFVSKANVIAVDGVVVARFHPWRDDCRSFRDRNPYCARWTDGSWSSDYSRSGWCPAWKCCPRSSTSPITSRPGSTPSGS